jgi:hypothetical protein
MMLLALRRNALEDHVLTDKVDDIAYWYHYDGIVLTWMLGTLSIKLQEIIHEPSETAWQAWLAIKAQFLDNHESCVLQLDKWFHSFRQGTLSISDYYRKMNGMADELLSLGNEMPDRHLVLQLLRGLSKK